MRLNDFNNLDTIQKADLIWEWGFFITKYKYKDYTIVVFLMDDFFAEVYLNIFSNEVENVTGLTKEELEKKDYLLVKKDFKKLSEGF